MYHIGLSLEPWFLIRAYHDHVMTWKFFPDDWPFVRGIHWSPVHFPLRKETSVVDFAWFLWSQAEHTLEHTVEWLVIGDGMILMWHHCIVPRNLYSDIIMSVLVSEITGVSMDLCFKAQIKENIKIHVTGLCEANTPVTGGFSSQRASNVKNVSIWWCHHEVQMELAALIICKTNASPIIVL